MKAAVIMVVLMGMTALSVDVGYLAMTKTQMQAAADSSTLSGGTELLPGLGKDPVTVTAVEVLGRAAAVAYAAKNRNGNEVATYVDSNRDVAFGWAKFNSITGQWEKHWSQQLPTVGGYNMIGVTVHRDQAGSSNADDPLPLFFANVLGHSHSTLTVKATAVIVPAKGIRIIPGSDIVANALPFAVYSELWDKLIVAQKYYETVYDPDDEDDDFPVPIDSVKYDAANATWSTDPTFVGPPLFGHYYTAANGNTEFRQDFYDDRSCACGVKAASSTVVDGDDGMLEVDLYPRDDFTNGNFGTIDIGSFSNSTADIERQILYGVNADDLSHYTNSEFVLPTTTQGDTGVSAGMKDELDAIIGECRAAYLFSNVVQPGNNATFSLTKLVGIRLMDVRLTASLEIKNVMVQMCDATLTGAIGATDEQIGEGTTVFSPLILIE